MLGSAKAIEYSPQTLMATRVPQEPHKVPSLNADSFTHLGEDAIDQALHAVQAIVKVATPSPLAKTFLDGLSEQARQRFEHALATHEICEKLLTQLKVARLKWMQEAAGVSLELVKPLRKTDSDLQQLAERAKELTEKESKHWPFALADFDRFFAIHESDFTNPELCPAQEAVKTFQSLRKTAVEATQWHRVLSGDNAPARYAMAAALILLPALSMALWRHVFDDHLSSVVAKAQEGWSAMSAVAVALGVPLGSLATLREPITKLLKRKSVGLTLLVLAILAAIALVRASMMMKELRFRCQALGLEAHKIQSSVNGNRRALCTEDPLWIDPSATVRFWAPRFQEVHKPLKELPVTDGIVSITLVTDTRFVHLSQETAVASPAGTTTWRVLFDNGGLTTTPVRLTVELSQAASGVGLQISTAGTNSDQCGAAPVNDDHTFEERSTQTIVLGASCFANQTTREFFVRAVNARSSASVAPLIFTVEHEQITTR